MEGLQITSTDEKLTFEKFYWTPNEYEVRLKGENFPTMYIKMKEGEYTTTVAENCLHVKGNNIKENFDKIQVELVEVENCDSSDLIKLPIGYCSPKSFNEKMIEAKEKQGYRGHEMFDFNSEYHNL